jgi:hypothetical protein
MTKISAERIPSIKAHPPCSPAKAGAQPFKMLARERERRGAPSWVPAFAGERVGG